MLDGIRLIEELSNRAWPALETINFDGWLLRFARGYTRRANSVQPRQHGGLDLDEKLRRCQEAYRSHGIPLVFKMTPAAEPPELDAFLEARGCQPSAYTSVLTLSLDRPRDLVSGEGPGSAGSFTNSCMPLDAAIRSSRPPAAAERAIITLVDLPDEPWLKAYQGLSMESSGQMEMLRQMLGLIPGNAAFLTLEDPGDPYPVAVGLAVADQGHVGLFDLRTRPDRRRTGWGTRAVQELLRWGLASGAHTAYLQVMIENQPAMALYRKLGFVELYQYWYRTSN
jgi:N-acetylglutamate synthase